jgi:predicted permease
LGQAPCTGHGPPRALLGVGATLDLFTLLGVQPALGRTFHRTDLTGECVVVLAHRFWQTLGSDPHLVGRALRLNDQSCTVVGIMGPAFVFFPEPTDLWMLIAPTSDAGRNPAQMNVAVFGRLSAGTTRAQAATELQRLADEGAGQRGFSMPRMTPLVNPLQEEFTWMAGRNLRVTLLTLFAAAGCMLAIACMNAVTLLLGRSVARSREIAIRAALGSSRARLLRQLATESLVLSLTGVAGGVLFALAAVRYLRRLNPVQLPPGADVAVDIWVLVFTILLGIVAGALSGLLPAWRTSRVSFGHVLSAGCAAEPPGRQRVTRFLIGAQTTLSVVLLIGAGALIHSAVRFASSPLGFDPTGAFAQEVVPPASAFAQPESRARLYQRIEETFAEQPALGDVALSSALAPRGEGPVGVLEREGREPPDPQRATFDVAQQSVSGRYFQVMRIAKRRGRTFDRRDSRDATPVCIVNEALVRKYFPSEDPVGQRVRFAGPPGGNRGPAPVNRWLTIIGIVADERRADVRQELGWGTTPIVYSPITQRAVPVVQLVVRPQGNIETGAVQAAILEVEPRIVVGTPRPLADVLSDYFRYPRFRAGLLAVFAMIALVLAATGLYALLAQTVAQRTRDIGVRLALGASRSSILADTIRDGMVLVAAGVVVGTIAAFSLRRVSQALLYEVSLTDLATVVPVIVLLVSAGLLACYLPARRASRVDPIVALRTE